MRRPTTCIDNPPTVFRLPAPVEQLQIYKVHPGTCHDATAQIFQDCAFFATSTAAEIFTDVSIDVRPRAPVPTHSRTLAIVMIPYFVLQEPSACSEKERKTGASAMKRKAAGVHLPSP